MCSPSSGSKQLAAASSDFSKQMMGQAEQVFGKDNEVFANIKSANDATIVSGPNQHGWSAGQRAEIDAATITNQSNAARFAAGATRTAQSGVGGGNTVSGSGVTTGQNLETAQRSAEATAGELNTNALADWQQGTTNFLNAEKAEMGATDVFKNMPGMDSAAIEGSKQASSDQAALDAQSNWGKNALLSLGEAGLGMVSSGLTPGGFLNKAKSGGGGAAPGASAIASAGAAQPVMDTSYAGNTL